MWHACIIYIFKWNICYTYKIYNSVISLFMIFLNRIFHKIKFFFYFWKSRNYKKRMKIEKKRKGNLFYYTSQHFSETAQTPVWYFSFNFFKHTIYMIVIAYRIFLYFSFFFIYNGYGDNFFNIFFSFLQADDDG